MSATDAIVAALGAHRLENGLRMGRGERVEWWRCLGCDWSSEEFDLNDSEVQREIEKVKRTHLASATLAAIKASGYAVVELPKPVDRSRVSTEFPEAVTYWSTTTEPRSITVDGVLTTPVEARRIAAAMIAAADMADAAEDNHA